MLGAVFRTYFQANRDEQLGLLDDLLQELSTHVSPEVWLNKPTLLIWGEHDELFPLEVARRAEALPGGPARVQVISRAAHMPNLEFPSEVSDLLIDFLL